MREARYYDKHRWRLKKGYGETQQGEKLYEELSETEWNPEFEKLMRNRLIMGGIRYDRIGQIGRKKYNWAEQIIIRAKKYLETGNKDLLVDAANYALLEFTDGNHVNAHFDGESEHDYHATEVK